MDHGVHVGLFGVFDGHNGGEASEFTSLYLPHLLRYHVWSIITSDINCELSGFCEENGEVDLAKPYNRGFEESMKEYTTLLNEKKQYHNCVRSQISVSLYRAILKEALSRALFDIDSAFSSVSIFFS
jgi:serine/threonine protein phosphatase PrpC